jgi:DNA-binding response OmpR family regulator
MTALKTILIIDDDHELNDLLTRYLRKFDFEVISATHPVLGLELIRKHSPDLIVLDVMLPGKNGFEVCKEIRREARTPIIMLTARGDLSDRVVGLELGADDYMPKPYEPRELVARIQSVLRRTQDYSSVSSASGSLHSLDLHVDLGTTTVSLAGALLDFTTTEFEILCLLMKNPGTTLSRDQILDQLRGIEWNNVDRTIDVLVSRIRHKLNDDPKTPRFLKTVWGSGYRFIGQVTRETA